MNDFEIIDVCHTIHHGMITYKGLPPPVISDHLSREQSRAFYAPGTEFHIGKIEMVANTGTYLDSPFHRYAGGKDLSELDLRSLANLEGVVVRCADGAEARPRGPQSGSTTGVGRSGRACVTPAVLEHLDVKSRSGARRDRLLQHRRHLQRSSPRAFDSAGPGHSDRRASLRPE